MKRSASRILILTAFFLISGASSTYAGAPGDDATAAITAAQQHFDSGVAAYKAAEYDQALEAFRSAYEQVPAAVFLYNAARVAQKLERFDESLKLAERAKVQVDRPLPEALIEKNTALIASLEQTIARDEAQKKARAKRMRAQAEATWVAAQQPKPTPLKSAPTPDAAPRWSVLGYSGAGVALVGLGLIGTSIYLSSDANDQIADLREIEDAKSFNQRLSEIDDQQSLGKGLLYSGITVAALGGAMVAWDLLTPTERPTSEAEPSEGPSITGVSLTIAPKRDQIGVTLGGIY